MIKCLPRRRRGVSLLELMLATSLTATVLVPALRLIRIGIKVSGELETRQLTATLCLGKLEENLCRAAATWTKTTLTGNYSAEGYSLLRYRVVTSDAVVDGGIVDQLMAVTATVWEDTNANSVVDSTELKTVMRSKIAKMATYQTAATN